MERKYEVLAEKRNRKDTERRISIIISITPSEHLIIISIILSIIHTFILLFTLSVIPSNYPITQVLILLSIQSLLQLVYFHSPQEVLQVFPLGELRQLSVQFSGNKYCSGQVRVSLHHHIPCSSVLPVSSVFHTQDDIVLASIENNIRCIECWVGEVRERLQEDKIESMYSYYSTTSLTHILSISLPLT